MKWIDTHCHVCDIEWDGSLRDGFAGHLLDVLDNDPGELHMVVCPDSFWFQRILASPQGIREAAQGIREIVQIAPDRLHGAFMPNPLFSDASLRLMDLCFDEWGFVMMGEMMQYSMNFRLAEPDCLRLLRHAAELGVPVMSHVATLDVKQGQMTGTGQLLDLLEAAARIPGLRVILGHFIGMAERNPSWTERYLDVVERYCGSWPRNFWAEIRDFGSPGLAPALERIPHDRLIAGTDWTTRGTPPFLPYGTLFECMINRVPEPYDEEAGTDLLAMFLERAGLSTDEIEGIAWKNAAALLGFDGAADPGPMRPDATEMAQAIDPTTLDWDPEQTRSVYVTEIRMPMTAEGLLERFRAVGLPAESAELALDIHTGRPWGYAIVHFADAESAWRSIALAPDELERLGVRPVYLTHRDPP